MRYSIGLPAAITLAAGLWAQNYTITTVAGTDRLRDGSPATSVPLRTPNAVVADSTGNLFVSDTMDSRIRKINPSGTIGTYVGVGLPYFGGDGGPGTSAAISGATALALDAAGNLYIADYDNCRIRKVSSAGVIATMAGNGRCTFAGDGGPAVSAQLAPAALALDASGNLYVADRINYRIRKITPAGSIGTIAGTGVRGYTGDGGPAASAQIGSVTGIALDASNNVYFSDYSFNRVRKISAGTGTITTVAGTGSCRYGGDNIPALSAQFDPGQIAMDGAGNIYIADSYNGRVRKIEANTGLIRTVAGNGSYGLSGDGGPASMAMLAYPTYVFVDSAGNLFIADQDNCRIRKVSVDGVITTVAGGSVTDSGAALSSYLNLPSGVAADAAGNVYIGDMMHHRVRKIAPTGLLSTLAGKGYPGYDNSAPGLGALLNSPMGVAVDASGNVYFADSGNYAIRKIGAGGILSTVAGTAREGFSGDGGLATAAQIGMPTSIALDNAGNLYFNDLSYYHIRKVNTAGAITTIAGNGRFEFAGDRGPATLAQLEPYDIAVDRDGVVYVADNFNHRVRKIDTAGIITTIAGTGFDGYEGDGGPATSARLSSPSGVALDANGNLYIADFGNFVVRRVSPAGVISTVAGNGKPYIAGDGGPALQASLDPYRLAVDAGGNLYVADWVNDRIRKLTAQTPARLAAVSGDNQTGVIGATLPTALTVRVTDAGGMPVAGVTVTFAVTSGTATLNPVSAVTAADGYAATKVTLGNTVGKITITATVAGLPVATLNVTAQAAAPVPLIFSGGVVSAGLSVPVVRAISPNAIMSIFGENFAPPGPLRKVDTADLVNGKLPTNFAGVCVLAGAELAPIFAVVSTQVNFQAPRLPASGTVQVQVISNCGTAGETRSAGEPVTVQATAPEFFYALQNPDGKNPIAGTHADTGIYVGAPGLIPGGAFEPARPGEILTLYLTGLGFTDPAFGPGVLPDRAGSVRGSVQVTMGGVVLAPADVLYAGVAPLNAGLFQVNVRVPAAVADGDQAVVISVDGVPSPPGGFITVRR